MTTRVREVKPVLGELRAAVIVVEGARQDAEVARSKSTTAQQRLAEVEERADRAADAVRVASKESRHCEQELTERLGSWLRDDHALDVVLPELTADNLAGLEALVHVAVAPVRARHEEAQGVAAAAIREGEQRTLALRAQRSGVAAETDPSPPEPNWLRDSRIGLAGAPLWRLIDFRDTLSESERAGVEAALEGAGLLDAWVHPDGRVIDDARRDVTLRASSRGAGPVRTTVAELLRPDVPDGCAVPAAVVESVLAGIGLDDHESEVAVTRDGRWRSGPAEGRTEKGCAQYIGATARVAERQRRLRHVGRGDSSSRLGPGDKPEPPWRRRVSCLRASTDGRLRDRDTSRFCVLG